MKKPVKKNNVVSLAPDTFNGYEVKYGVPMPPKVRESSMQWDYSKLKKGGHVFIPVGVDKLLAKKRMYALTSGYRSARNRGKFIDVIIDMRVIAEKGKWGVGIWRR